MGANNDAVKRPERARPDKRGADRLHHRPPHLESPESGVRDNALRPTRPTKPIVFARYHRDCNKDPTLRRPSRDTMANPPHKDPLPAPGEGGSVTGGPLVS